MTSIVNTLVRIAKMVSLVVVVVACARDPNISVKREWTNAVRSFAMIPVYPMRENVYVGDLRVTGDRDDPFALNYRNFGHIDVSTVLEREMRALPQFPVTEPPSNGQLAFGQPKATGSINSHRGTPNRLNMVALPGVELATLRGADLAAHGPVGGVAGLFNLGFRKNDVVKLTLKGVESMEITDQNAWPALLKRCGQLKGVTNSVNSTALAASVRAVTTAEDGPAKPSLHMITRVFYARSIVYTTNRVRQTGGNFSTGASQEDIPDPGDPLSSIPPLLNDGKQSSSAGTTTDTQGAATAGTVEEPSAGSVQVRSETPGVSASFVSASESAVSLTQIFERPLAFAVDVLTIELGDAVTASGETAFQCAVATTAGLTEGLTGTSLSAETDEE